MENKNTSPTISVIIRTKNEEKYLGQVLKIIKQQTYQNFEIMGKVQFLNLLNVNYQFK